MLKINDRFFVHHHCRRLLFTATFFQFHVIFFLFFSLLQFFIIRFTDSILHLSFSHSRIFSIVCLLDMNILLLGLETHDAYAIIIIFFVLHYRPLSALNCMDDISSINVQFFFFLQLIFPLFLHQLQSLIFRFYRHHHFSPRHQ